MVQYKHHRSATTMTLQKWNTTGAQEGIKEQEMTKFCISKDTQYATREPSCVCHVWKRPIHYTHTPTTSAFSLLAQLWAMRKARVRQTRANAVFIFRCCYGFFSREMGRCQSAVSKTPDSHWELFPKQFWSKAMHARMHNASYQRAVVIFERALSPYDECHQLGPAMFGWSLHLAFYSKLTASN